jgi:tripartite-type tricarboxylate transporter receptor subunit TctC
MRNTVVTLLVWVVSGQAGIVAAQDAPISFLTTYTAAGSSSRTATIMTPKLEEYFGLHVEIDYSAGLEAAMAAPSDGKTIFISTVGPMALHPNITASSDFDPVRDLRPVTLLTATPDVLLVSPGLGIATLDELIAYAREHPGDLTYAYIAPRSIHRIEFVALLGELGIDARPDDSIRGPVDSMDAIASGGVDLVIITSPYAASLIENGSAVPLLVAHPTRIPLLPDVPTTVERGVSSVPHGSWAGLFTSAGTSEEHVERIFSAVQYALSDPAVAAQINDLGMEISLSESPQAFSEYIQAEGARLKATAEKYGIAFD